MRISDWSSDVCSSDLTYGKAFIDVDLDGWSSMIARNVQSLTEITYAFAKRFAAQRRGAIVIVSSSAALGGSARIGIYSATKAFGLNLGESLWAELAPFGEIGRASCRERVCQYV